MGHKPEAPMVLSLHVVIVYGSEKVSAPMIAGTCRWMSDAREDGTVSVEVFPLWLLRSLLFVFHLLLRPVRKR